MAALTDGQWSLEYDSTVYTFGTPADGFFLTGPPAFGAVDFTTDDADLPRGDGRSFGQDYRRAQTIAFELAAVDDAGEAAVMARLSAIGAAWRGDGVRSVGGKVATLRSSLAGRARCVYGRPRRYAPDLTHSPEGAAIVLADFACVDDVFYDDTLSSLVVGIVPPPGAGLIAPLAAPLATAMSSGSKPGTITVAGDVATWPVITISGPITTPEVEVVNVWSITLATSIAAGDSVTIDTRPWHRSITRASGGSLAGAVTRASRRITRASLAPGTVEVVLRGTDLTGTASLRFEWRDAYTTL